VEILEVGTIIIVVVYQLSYIHPMVCVYRHYIALVVIIRRLLIIDHNIDIDATSAFF